MPRDIHEPIAHIVRDLDELITPDGEPFEDTRMILKALIERALAAHGGMSMAQGIAMQRLDLFCMELFPDWNE